MNIAHEAPVSVSGATLITNDAMPRKLQITVSSWSNGFSINAQ
jgi:hypothetical protein